MESRRSRYSGANALKFFLMPFVCFACFGLPGNIGMRISTLSQFAAPAFFLLCGFFYTRNETERNSKNRKLVIRTALRFGALFAVYLIINLIYFTVAYNVPLQSLLSALLHKRVLFEFIVLCAWPFDMGKPIWFIQSLLYIRIVLWMMHKWKLMRFYKPLMIIGFLAMLLTSELASAVHFNFLGYPYLTANWLTCALPYMMLGRLLYEKREKLLALPTTVCAGGALLGIVMAFAEFSVLDHFGYLRYTGNAVGFGVTAFSLCCLFLRRDFFKHTFFAAHGKTYSWRIYVMSQPVRLILLLVSESISAELLSTVQKWGGIIVYVVCLVLAFLIGYVIFFTKIHNDGAFMRKWRRWLH